MRWDRTYAHTRPDLEVGICGEHGGEPNSVQFCHRIGMNYVSCSPYRVPIARWRRSRRPFRGKNRKARVPRNRVPGAQCAKCNHRLISGLNSWKALIVASIRIVSDPAMNIAVPRWYFSGHHSRDNAAAP